MSWYTVTDTDRLDSPALLVYRARVVDNIRRAIAIAGDVDRLRPHVKTHKMRAVTDLLLAGGVRRFKCATVAEAEMLAEAGAPDVLLAYPLVGPKAERLRTLRAAYPQTAFSALTDQADAARQLSAVFRADPLAVYLDLNVGMNRTGVAPAEAVALYETVRSLPGLRVAGLHAYDGHIRDTDLTDRQHRTDAAYALVQQVQAGIRAVGGGELPVVMGGSPSFPCHAGRSNVEVSPGTFVFWDAGYGEKLPDLPFEPAALLLTRVISVLDDRTVCLDLGHKAVAAENPLPRVHFLNVADADPIAQSEEHLVVRVPDAGRHRVGEVWYGLPVHICPTVALYDSAAVIVDGRVVATWPVTARGRQLVV